MGIDYYGVLGLTRNCDDLQIKRAYRRLAIETNPERHAKRELKEVFALIGEAYDVLSQPKWRAVYDQYGEEGMKKGVPSPQGWIPPYAYHGDPVRTYREFYGTSSPYADLLQFELPTMDEWRGRALKKKGSPLVQTLQLTLKEIYLGAIKKMERKRRVFADDLEETTCVKYEILTIPIKPGLPPGTEIVFPEKGDCGHSVIPGDIIFVTEDLPHSTYRREGVNLLATIEIDLQEALTGKTIVLETLDQRQIRVPITQVVYQDYVKVVHSEGMPYVDEPDRFGDLLIDFRIKFPIYLPEDSKRFIKRAMETAGTDGHQLADLVLQYVGPENGGLKISNKHQSKGEGTVFSLRSRRQQDSYLSVELGGPEAIKVVHSGRNGTQTILVPASLGDGNWHYLALGIQDDSSVRSYVDCRWVSTDILRRNELDTPDDADLVIGYLFSGDLEQLVIVPDPRAVSQQCSATKQPSLDPLLEATRPRRPSAFVRKALLASNEFPGANSEITVTSSSVKKQPTTPPSTDPDISSWQDLDTDLAEEGSGLHPDSNDQYELEWSEWSRCTGGECGGSGHQTRTSRCVDTGGWLELCLESGAERTQTRACTMPPCNTTNNHNNGQGFAHCECHNGGVCVAASAGIKRRPCRCPPGFGGRRCENFACHPRCLNGGSCVAPNTCTCTALYHGTNCQTAICDPPCDNGGQCVTPQQCLCPPATYGNNCQNYTCRGGCLNGGLCVGPDLCECQNNSTGPRCSVPVCEPPCENGATCAFGNICLCAPHTSGTRCHTKKCDYRPVQEPYTRGYRRLVKKHLQTKCETWTWKTCVRTLPEYQTVYKTYYRTIYKCVDQL